jgi:hypothetical protein
MRNTRPAALLRRPVRGLICSALRNFPQKPLLRDFFNAWTRRSAGNLGAMRLGIRGAFAKCSGCQGEDFYPAFPLTPDRREVMVCAHCENQHLYAELIGRSQQGSEPAEEKNKWTTAETPTKTSQPRRSRPR